MQVIKNLMIMILEPTVQFFSSSGSHFRESARVYDCSSVGFLQVETFLHMFSALLNDYFSHKQKRLKSLGGSFGANSVGQTRASMERVEGKLPKLNFSNAADDCSALKYLLAFAYIWGFVSSLSERYRDINFSQNLLGI